MNAPFLVPANTRTLLMKRSPPFFRPTLLPSFVIRVQTGIKSTSQRNQRAQATIAKIESEPHQHTEIDREQRLAEERISNAQLNADGAAEITGQQDGSENRRLGNEVEDGADEKGCSDGDDQVLGQAELSARVENSAHPHHL